MTGDYRIVITNRRTGQDQTVSLSEAELEDLRLSMLRHPTSPERRMTRDELRTFTSGQANLARALEKVAQDARRNSPGWREIMVGDMEL